MTDRTGPGSSRTGQPWTVELFSSLQAADIAWSWMRTGSLPVGMEGSVERSPYLIGCHLEMLRGLGAPNVICGAGVQ